jgi:hypothetical protein
LIKKTKKNKTKKRKKEKKKRNEKKKNENKTAGAFPRSSLNLGVLADKNPARPSLNAKPRCRDNPGTNEFHSFTGKGSPSN